MAYLNEIQELEENIAFWERAVEYWEKSSSAWINYKIINKSKLSEDMKLVALEHLLFSKELVGLLGQELVEQKKEVTYA